MKSRALWRALQIPGCNYAATASILLPQFVRFFGRLYLVDSPPARSGAPAQLCKAMARRVASVGGHVSPVHGIAFLLALSKSALKHLERYSKPRDAMSQCCHVPSDVGIQFTFRDHGACELVCKRIAFVCHGKPGKIPQAGPSRA